MSDYITPEQVQEALSDYRHARLEADNAAHRGDMNAYNIAVKRYAPAIAAITTALQQQSERIAELERDRDEWKEAARMWREDAMSAAHPKGERAVEALQAAFDALKATDGA